MRPVKGRNISEAWVNAMDVLLKDGGKSLNVMVEIENPMQECAATRHIFDEFVCKLPTDKVPHVTTVANTIFPSALYHPRLGDAGRNHLYEMHSLGRQVARRLPANSSGSYFDRLVAYPQADGTSYNQLEKIVERLKTQMAGTNRLSSAYELGTSIVGVDDCEDVGESGMEFHHDARIQCPGRDRRTRAFPCLSHISLTLMKDGLHMTAIYRNQHFISRAYGNYVGLGNLLGFLSHEAGCEPGTLVCVATHADAEIGARGLGKGVVATLVKRCRFALESEATPQENET